ncbi:MAG: flavin reductase family protein [Promethearchaeota archaeon]|jgi:flavin reductase (DIM6/NTAB) family NADH-FMN oxidoreductase RutF
MTKNKIRPGVYLYPMPVSVIGTNVNGKPNFMALAWVNIVEYKPPVFAIASYETHHTNVGIKENGTFSVNIPSEEMVVAADYVGLVSGKEVDKSDVFEVFYGELETAPMITEAPINVECKVVKTIDTKEFTGAEKGHEIFIGRVINAYAEEKYLTNEIPDIKKVKPFVFSIDNNYWEIGKHLGNAFSIGKDYKKK